ncbi:MAG: AVAST type 2 anti-phage system protein Avs2 [Candidatus Binatia bacterium]
MEAINVDWKSIRPINGTCPEGFEELCSQLADAERPKDTSFVRKGRPDAGVECYAAFADGTEWGWQAKYFDTLGDSQWSQLDHSVQTALDKHPRLVRYFVCLPLDLSDARTEGRRSTRDRWNDRVEKWSGWARDRAMDVGFVYWGRYELIERLSRPENRGRLWFWFNRRYLDPDWFEARLDEAIKSAGPRYTPEIHVELPIAAKFEAFGRTERFIDALRVRARSLREKSEHLRSRVDLLGESAGIRDKSKDGLPEGDQLEGQIVAVAGAVGRVISRLVELRSDPIGPLRLRELADEIDAIRPASGALEQTLRDHEKTDDEREAKIKAEGKPEPYRPNPFRERRHRLYELQRELRELNAALIDADIFAGATLLVLTGHAGTGKTHLLCDITRARLRDGRPTVLLMGQRFLSNENPWMQALQHLDLAHLSAEEFVGALEAAAQTAGCRALVLIDALNEGAGRRIWPEHLTAFLAHLSRSAWISIVLAVRSSYEQMVIPEEIRRRAVKIEHYGSSEVEYDAARTFFDYYGLERPSTPLLVPEFSNPLFLKVLCRGLSASGHRRLPRGFHGISATFNLFLDAVNARLATDLGFNPNRQFVRKAIESLVRLFVERRQSWLPFEEAEDVVNGLLPGREFERSLFRGLVSDGVLIEEVVWRDDGTAQEVVRVTYERLSDHLFVQTLLDLHLDPERPEAAFGNGGRLEYLVDPKEYVSPGLIEAFCVQLPERTEKELSQVAPKLQRRRIFAEAFRQSLIWRSPKAFSETTRTVLNEITRSEHDIAETLDALLTMATVPDHPFNAAFLHARLSRDSMPERDAWWSIFLHRAWGSRRAVDRLVEWAWSVTPGMALEDEAVDLTAAALAWMLTSSNRFLRDRATKALVSLLTGRLTSVVRLLDRFADVDDLYVAERLYAIAYGCALRSHDAKEVGHLAQTVYDRVFKNGSPPAHILLRDYARGVIERGLYLGAALDGEPDRIRPPYQSNWPPIPTEEEIAPLKPDWNRGAYDSRDLEWARNRIGSSVLDDDFARYVIGTNSSVTSWLSLRREEPLWRSPDERLAALVESFGEREKLAWEAYDSADRALKEVIPFNIKIILENHEQGAPDDGEADDVNAELDKRILELEQVRESALTKALGILTPHHADQLREILAATRDTNACRPPSFDLRLIQRYVLWRVFDLGWTIKRFGHFDRFDIGYEGRAASKAERIGKKYQWIAYHEILALIADHFQYRSWHGSSEDDNAHVGPWQDSFRDIDPSCTLREQRGGTSWDGHLPAWWGSSTYEDWTGDADHEEWVKRTDDLPSVERLLVAVNPQDGSRWLNLDGYLNWKQPAPLDRDPHDVDRREIWYMGHGYLVPGDETAAFMLWAEAVDFWGHWMPKPHESYKLFLGEHGWSPAARYFESPYYGVAGWIRADQGCPARVCVASFRRLEESSGFDCSIDDSYTLRLPCSDLVRALGLQWSGNVADFVDGGGTVIAFDPTAHSVGPSALLVRQEALLDCLERERLALCWSVIGEKRVLTAGDFYSLRISGAFTLKGGEPTGFLKCIHESRTTDKGSTAEPMVVTLRTSERRP